MVGVVGADAKFIRDALSAMLSMLQALPLDGEPEDESAEWLARLGQRLREEVPVAINKFERRRPELAGELRRRLALLVEALTQKAEGLRDKRSA